MVIFNKTTNNIFLVNGDILKPRERKRYNNLSNSLKEQLMELEKMGMISIS